MPQSTSGKRRTIGVAFFLLFVIHRSQGAIPRFGFFGRKPNSTAAVVATRPTSDSSSSWKNFLTMDASKIMTTLITHGGLVLPKSIQDELLAVMKVCHVERAEWNPVQKRLLFSNFTVVAPGMEEYSLRVGRVSIAWESYSKPCLNIEVDDVDVVLEFSNLLLTKNNWDELRTAGFPPAMMLAQSDKSAVETSSAEDSYSFVRIGSMDLSGKLRAVVRSRPLNREVCPSWILDLDTFDEWNVELKRLSHENLVESGRRGCSTSQMYEWMESYVGSKLKSILAATAYDLATQPFAEQDTKTVKRAKGLLNHARKAVTSYAQQATAKSGQDLQEQVKIRLDSLGLNERIRLGSEGNENTTSIQGLGNMKRVLSAYKILRDAAAEQLGNTQGALGAVEDAGVDQPEIILPNP